MVLYCNFPHVHIKASLELRKNIDGVVDIVVKVRTSIQSIRTSLEEKVSEELEQLLRGYGLVDVIIRIVY